MTEISFPFPGGKAKIRDELFKYFPDEGNLYCEPFAGRGNIFFEFYKKGGFKSYWINDLKNGRFFKAIKEVSLGTLPAEVPLEDFDIWQSKALINDPVALCLEPKITFRGKGYEAGYQTGRYNRSRYGRMLFESQRILLDTRVKITQQDYIWLPFKDFTEEDFVVLDPPYLDATKGVGYSEIDHKELLKLLASLKCRWAICGYQTELYLKVLGAPVMELVRNIEMTDTKGQTSIECLWTSGY